MKNEKGKNIFKKWSKNASREVQKSKLGPLGLASAHPNGNLHIYRFGGLYPSNGGKYSYFGGSPIFSYGHPVN